MCNHLINSYSFVLLKYEKYLIKSYLFNLLNHVSYLIALYYLFFSFMISIHLSPHWIQFNVGTALQFKFQVSLKLGDVSKH